MLRVMGAPLAATDRSVAQLRTPGTARAMFGAGAAAVVLALLLLAMVTHRGLLDRGPADPPTSGSPPAAAIGGDLAAYRISGANGTLSAENPAQRLSSRFEASGVLVRSGDLVVGMRLRAVGGRDLATGRAPAPTRADAPTRVVYRHSALTEWYLNGPRGLEQGYILTRAPAGTRAGALTLAIGISGDARARISRDARSISFSRGRTALRYGGLTAIDATGRKLHSSLELAGSQLRLRVDARGARYPVQIDPLIEQGGKLTGGGEQGAGQFGLAVALSADGNTAVVGAPRDQEFAGAAWAFTRSGETWSQQGGKLTSGELESVGSEAGCDEESEGDDCGFGRALAVSADGSTALIGAPRVNEGQGAAWIFTRSGGTWTRGQKLVGGGEETNEGHFGRGVALSSDGKTALVGAPGDRSHRGSTWTFVRSGSTWSQQGAKLIPSNAVGQAHFGGNVALSANGATALVGAPGDSGNVGASWVLSRSGASWAQDAKLTGGEEAGAAHMGVSVALSGAGDTALIGGRRDAGDLGAAWAFKRSGGSWSQQGAKLIGDAEGARGEFGFSVTLSDDGNTALIGAPRDNSAEGAVRRFTRTGDSWTAQTEQLAGAGATGNLWFGASVAIAGDGATALVGASHDDARVGAAWAFADRPFSTQPPAVANVTPAEGPAAGGTSVRIEGTNFSAAGAVRFGSLAAASFIVRSATVIEAVTPPAPAGAVDVTVSTPAGTSAIDPSSDRFTFTGQGPGGGPGAGAVGSAGAAGTAGIGVLGSIGSASARCQVALANRRIAVQAHRSAVLRLLRSGAGSCSGRLTLRYKLKLKGRRYKLKTIGTAIFSIPPAKSQVVKIKLNAYGHGLLRRGHGRLNASLAILRLRPAPALGRTASVRLSVKKAPKRL